MANGNYEVQLRLNVILVNVFKEKLQQIELFSFYSFKIRYLKYSPPFTECAVLVQLLALETDDRMPLPLLLSVTTSSVEIFLREKIFFSVCSKPRIILKLN